ASAMVSNSRAFVRIPCDLTALFASKKATLYAFMSLSSKTPKLLMARAAAPMFKGFRGETSTTRRFICRGSFFAADGVQHAVDKGHGFVARKLARQVERLVDRD